MSDITIGIDPGNYGGIAILRDGELDDVTSMPIVTTVMSKRKRHIIDRWELAGTLRPYSADLSKDRVRAYVELVRARPKQGLSSTARFAESYGILLGITAAYEIPTYQIAPSGWRPAMVGRGSDKQAARYKAMEKWPNFAGKFRRVKDDGVAEAALIAEYGRTYLNY